MRADYVRQNALQTIAGTYNSFSAVTGNKHKQTIVKILLTKPPGLEKSGRKIIDIVTVYIFDHHERRLHGSAAAYMFKQCIDRRLRAWAENSVGVRHMAATVGKMHIRHFLNRIRPRYGSLYGKYRHGSDNHDCFYQFHSFHELITYKTT